MSRLIHLTVSSVVLASTRCLDSMGQVQVQVPTRHCDLILSEGIADDADNADNANTKVIPRSPSPPVLHLTKEMPCHLLCTQYLVTYSGRFDSVIPFGSRRTPSPCASPHGQSRRLSKHQGALELANASRHGTCHTDRPAPHEELSPWRIARRGQACRPTLDGHLVPEASPAGNPPLFQGNGTVTLRRHGQPCPGPDRRDTARC